MSREPAVGQIWKKNEIDRFIRIESWIGDSFRVCDVERGGDGAWSLIPRKTGSPFIPPRSLLQRFEFHASE